MAHPVARLALAAAALLLASCSLMTPAPGPVEPPPLVLHDELFPGASLPAEAGQLFDLSPGMRSYLESYLERPGHGLTPLAALARAVSRQDMLHLVYDASRTRTAAQAFDERAGNCLSLVLMTAAFAHALNLRVEYHQAEIDPYWSRNGELLLASGHINLTVLPPLRDVDSRRDTQNYLFDFLDGSDAQSLPRHDVSEQTVVAMFLNNRAAEALQADQLVLAYAYARQAVRQDPGFAPAYNTLGVIYLGRGAGSPAETAFRAALKQDPANTRTLSNLIDALRTEGNASEADRLATQLARLEPEPPFHFFDLGVAAYQRREYATAQGLFRRETARTDYSAELHFWMARTAWALGQPARAEREIEQALERSSTGGDRTRYAAKLEWLRGQAHAQD